MIFFVDYMHATLLPFFILMYFGLLCGKKIHIYMYYISFLQVPLYRAMDDEGKSCIPAELSDMLESVSFLDLVGKPSPMESTVLYNPEEQEVRVGFVMCPPTLSLIHFSGFSSGKYFCSKKCSVPKMCLIILLAPHHLQIGYNL